MAKALDRLIETFRPRHRLTPEEYLAKLAARGLNPDGSPVLDPTPIAPPIGYVKAPSMVEIVRDMVRSERLRQEVSEHGFETLEEAEDFEVSDEPVPLRSQWENEFDPPVAEVRAAAAAEAAEPVNSPAPVAGAEAPEGAPAPVPAPAPAPKAPAG